MDQKPLLFIKYQSHFLKIHRAFVIIIMRFIRFLKQSVVPWAEKEILMEA
jgi:hypothetical protein